jgi:hypothetical protein
LLEGGAPMVVTPVLVVAEEDMGVAMLDESSEDATRAVARVLEEAAPTMVMEVAVEEEMDVVKMMEEAAARKTGTADGHPFGWCGKDHEVIKLMVEVNPAYCKHGQRFHGISCSKCNKGFVGTKADNPKNVIQPSELNGVHYCSQSIGDQDSDDSMCCAYAICGDCYGETISHSTGRGMRSIARRQHRP